MPDWYSHYIYLILGVISFSGTAVSTCTGKTRSRFQGWVYRAKEPTPLLWVVAIYYLAVFSSLESCWAISKSASPRLDIKSHSLTAFRV
jgi:hypothetical protein